MKNIYIYKECCDKIKGYSFYFYFRSRKVVLHKAQGVLMVVNN